MDKIIYLGYQYGSFEDEKSGRKVSYAHLFAMVEFDNPDNPDYHTDGYKGDKIPLKDTSVLKGLRLAPLDVIEVYYDKKGKVTKIVPVENASAEDWMEEKSEVA